MSRAARVRAPLRGGGRAIFATETNTGSKGSRANFVCIAVDSLIFTSSLHLPLRRASASSPSLHYIC